MQNILDKIKDILSRKGMIKTIVVVLVLGGMGIYALSSKQERNGHKIENNHVVTSEKDDGDGLTDPTEIEIEPTGRDVPVTTEPIPENTDPETIEIEDDKYYINSCTQAIEKWIEQDGRFTNLTQNEEDWYIIDCSTLVESEPKFAGMYELRTTVNNIDPVYNSDGELRYPEKGTIYLDCFATDNGDGTATIHYLGSSIGVLINDDFVSEEMKNTTVGM